MNPPKGRKVISGESCPHPEAKGLSHSQIGEDVKSPKSLILPLPGCATSGKSLNLSEPPKGYVRVILCCRLMVAGEREQIPGAAKVFRSVAALLKCEGKAIQKRGGGEPCSPVEAPHYKASTGAQVNFVSGSR